mgnify:CR=1 FL=1
MPKTKVQYNNQIKFNNDINDIDILVDSLEKTVKLLQ